MRGSILLLVALTACEPGPNSETLIDNLQIIAAVAEPAQVAPLEPFELNATVIDATDAGFDVLFWQCLGDECATINARVLDDEASATAVSPAPSPGWIMACAPGVCDLSDVPQRKLLDPLDWLQKLPQDGVSLVSWFPNVTEDTEDPLVNPVIEVAPDAEVVPEVAVEKSLVLDFVVPGAETAWGYTTGGGFRRPSEDIASTGEVSVEWFAPAKTGEEVLYVVFVNDLGGTVVWRGEASVR